MYNLEWKLCSWYSPKNMKGVALRNLATLRADHSFTDNSSFLGVKNVLSEVGPK